jgi:DNA-directed RNA polymerase specialized sigma24 family protein
MTVLTQEVDRHDSGMSGTAFTRLLRWLDDGSDSQGERYLEMRRRLVAYFDRRNRPAPDVLADETFDRVSRTLEESGRIKVTPPARYCYVVARFVLLEDIRRSRRDVPFEETRAAVHQARAVLPGTDETAEQSLDCLGRCLATLKPEDRHLIVEYYRDAKRQRIERRRELARQLGITMNALGIRAWRLRASLERCVGACRKGSERFLPQDSYPKKGPFSSGGLCLSPENRSRTTS